MLTQLFELILIKIVNAMHFASEQFFNYKTQNGRDRHINPVFKIEIILTRLQHGSVMVETVKYLQFQ